MPHSSLTVQKNSAKSLPLFYPPRLNRPFVQVLHVILPRLTRWTHQIELAISRESLERLISVRDQPCLFLCNHPTFQDPLVMFLLSARLGVGFHYLTAYEQFQGIQRWLYPQVGAYSIRRGMADRNSIAQTIDLMMQPDCKLVIFPEGGCSFQNDTVMPFRPGAIQMAMQALAKRVKRGEELQNFFVVPISLKYHYTGDMTQVIDRTLQELEKALNIGTSGNFYQRLRLIAEQVILHCEAEYQMTDLAHESWNTRIINLKSQVLEQCEQRLGLSPALGEADRERVYRVRHVLETRRNTLLADGVDGWDVMYQAMTRILNFDAIYDGYVAAQPTSERFLDTLIRLEREVFKVDQPPSKGYRQAFLRVAEPMNLKDYFAAYSANRSTTIEHLMQEIQQTMQTDLNLLAEGLVNLFGKLGEFDRDRIQPR